VSTAWTRRRFSRFRGLPLMTRENYHQRYPLAQRCRDGRLENCDIIAVSSGSTGRPAYWPRFLADELAVAARFEQVFHDSFEADRQPTLAVVCCTANYRTGSARPQPWTASATPIITSATTPRPSPATSRPSTSSARPATRSVAPRF
jgi:phenylacetate-coenzyme A ligase PaaK-like adenylate-forming protein